MTSQEAKSILVVEDDELTRTFLRHALATVGMTTVDAGSGEEAIDRIRSGDGFAAALVDGLLPDMHGLVLARRLLDEPAGAELPLLFVTGALRHPVEARAGVAAMTKPIGVGDLVRQVRWICEWQASGGSPGEERREALAALEAGFLVSP